NSRLLLPFGSERRRLMNEVNRKTKRTATAIRRGAGRRVSRPDGAPLLVPTRSAFFRFGDNFDDCNGDPERASPACEARNGPVAQASVVRCICRGTGRFGRAHVFGGHR